MRWSLRLHLKETVRASDEGIELADTVDAEVEVAQRAQQIQWGILERGVWQPGRIIVADDNWQSLFELPF